MKIVILISAGAEWRGTKEILPGLAVQLSPFGEYAEAKLGAHNVTLFQGGWGKISAAASAQCAIDQFRPDLLVNLGTCGGFAGRIECGEIILVERTLVYDIVELMSDPAEALRRYATELDLSWLDRTGMPPAATGLDSLRRGPMLSADRDVLPADIPELVSMYGALAADWESGAIAWVANRNKIRCLILRGVTDLVSAGGDDVYGDYPLFEERARAMMGRLLWLLPQLLGEPQEGGSQG